MRLYNRRFLARVVSSAGRASALQAEGRRFDPVTTHQIPLEFGSIDTLSVDYLER